MTKPPAAGTCTYCLRSFRTLTWDHVLPLSWYPAITPEDIEKWKVPACKECNSSYGAAEKELLIRLGLCLGPDELLALGISDKALRSVRPEHGKTPGDRRAREKKREALLREIVSSKTLPETGVFPNFGPVPGIAYDEYHIVTIPHPLITSYAVKLVRGLSRILDDILLSADYVIEPYFIKDEDILPLIEMFKQHGRLFHRGLGFQLSRLTREDNRAWIYAIQIWGRLRFYATVHPPGEITPIGSTGAA